MYYSLFDTDTKDYLHTGLNSPSRKEAINDGIDLILSDGGSEAPSKVKRLSLKDKESYLSGHSIIVEEHPEKFPDEDDFDFDVPVGTQRSPFGIGS